MEVPNASTPRARGRAASGGCRVSLGKRTSPLPQTDESAPRGEALRSESGPRFGERRRLPVSKSASETAGSRAMFKNMVGYGSKVTFSVTVSSEP